MQKALSAFPIRPWLLLLMIQLPLGAPSAFAQWPATEAKPVPFVKNASKGDPSAAEIAQLESIIKSCLRHNERDYEVRIRMSFASNGTFLKLPEIIHSSAGAETQSVLNSLINCQPYRFPPASYASWKELDITFRTGTLR